MAIKSRVNSQGQDELFDEDTGEIIAVGKKKERDKAGRRSGRSYAKGKMNQWVKVRNADGEVCMVPAGTDPSTLPAKKLTYVYNQLTKDLIIQEVLKGKTLPTIARMEGMPTYDVLAQWRIKYPEFETEIRRAKKFRGEYRAEMAMDFVDTTTKDTNIEDRLKVELLKWGASVDDPDQYGARVKHSGDAQNPVAWVIQTGVPQPDEKPIEVESSPVEQVEAPDVHE